MGDQINSKDFLIGTLIGSIVGASVALLFAPKSGRELREDINKGASQVMDRASELKDTAQEKGADWKDIAYEKGSELTKKATELSKTVAQKTKDLKDTVQETIEKKREENAETLEVGETVGQAGEEADQDESQDLEEA